MSLPFPVENHGDLLRVVGTPSPHPRSVWQKKVRCPLHWQIVDTVSDSFRLIMLCYQFTSGVDFANPPSSWVIFSRDQKQLILENCPRNPENQLQPLLKLNVSLSGDSPQNFAAYNSQAHCWIHAETSYRGLLNTPRGPRKHIARPRKYVAKTSENMLRRNMLREPTKHIAGAF